jgi:RHS repeat-associated protein
MVTAGGDSYTYDANNKMTAAGGDSFTYDSNGNTIGRTGSSGNATWGYDYENRMTSSSTPQGNASFVYSGDGLRVRKVEGAYTGNYLYDGVRVYAKYDDNWNEAARFMIEGESYYDPLVAERVGGNWYYPLYDALGSTRRLINAGEAVTDSYSYEAFGGITAQSGSTYNPYKYVGSLGYYSADYTTGLLHLGARYFNPSHGRFWAKDPLGRDSADTNLYEYVGNRPASMVDPSGAMSVAAAGALLYVLGCGGLGMGWGAVHGSVEAPGRRWPQRDKFIHCVSACAIRTCGTVVASWALGLLKEAFDARFGLRPSGWDRADLAANHEGEKCAKKKGTDCTGCCKDVYPCPSGTP